MKEFGKYLIDSYLKQIGEAITENSCCLVKAGPGAGKTTRVPLHLLDLFKGNILVLEPRRLAARLSAERCAWFLNQKVGEVVGHSVRQDVRKGPLTRLHFITEGLLTRMLQEDSQLSQTEVVLLDEFHERHLQTDLALALIRQLQQTTRPDLKLLVMSATLDTTALEKFLEKAKVFDIPGKTWPVEIDYSDQNNLPWEEKVIKAIVHMTQDRRCPGHILVFLTGLGEIRKIESLLKAVTLDNVDIIPLAASLGINEQALAFADSPNRKIILATNVAETSLTIPGVTGVIDLGLAKVASLAHWSGMSVLEVRPVAKASAIQRAGRAGRTQEGVVYRLYSEAEYRVRDEFMAPEIQRLDLSHTLLEILALNLNPEFIPWFEQPDQKQWARAWELLGHLEAVEEDVPNQHHPSYKLTSWGKALAQLPLHPRLGAVALAGKEQDYAAEALLAACILSEGSLWNREKRAPNSDGECDLCEQVDLIKSVVLRRPNLYPGAQYVVDIKKVNSLYRLFQTLAPLVQARPLTDSPTDPSRLGPCLLRGYPDRVAMNRSTSNKNVHKTLYNFCLGRGGKLIEQSSLFSHPPDFLLVTEASENLKANAAQGTLIRMASKITLKDLLARPHPLLKSQKEEIFNEAKGIRKIEEKIYYGKLCIDSRLTETKLQASEDDLIAYLKKNWPEPFRDVSALEEYHGRVRCLQAQGAEHSCPIFEGEMLELFQESIGQGRKSTQELLQMGLEKLIYEQLGDWDLAQLHQFAPLSVKLPNGKSFRVHYGSNGQGTITGLIQDFYGLTQNPVVGEKTPLKLCLLAPSKRPAQVTSDIAGFWRGPYAEVKKELSRRYPKHYWPEDPTKARPILLKKNVT